MTYPDLPDGWYLAIPKCEDSSAWARPGQWDPDRAMPRIAYFWRTKWRDYRGSWLDDYRDHGYTLTPLSEVAALQHRLEAMTDRAEKAEAEKEAAEKALLHYRNPLLWPSPIQPPYIATCQTEQTP